MASKWPSGGRFHGSYTSPLIYTGRPPMRVLKTGLVLTAMFEHTINDGVGGRIFH